MTAREAGFLAAAVLALASAVCMRGAVRTHRRRPDLSGGTVLLLGPSLALGLWALTAALWAVTR